jgi:hypothetical protein
MGHLTDHLAPRFPGEMSNLPDVLRHVEAHPVCTGTVTTDLTEQNRRTAGTVIHVRI